MSLRIQIDRELAAAAKLLREAKRLDIEERERRKELNRVLNVKPDPPPTRG